MLFRLISILIAVAALVPSNSAKGQLAPSNDVGVSFGHLHLNVTDFELQKSLWSELFGGVEVERGGLVGFRFPGALVFLRDAEPTAPSRGTAVDHLGFRVKNLARILETWRSRGYRVDSERVDQQGASIAFITMPDGAILELIQDASMASETELDHIHFFTLDGGSLDTFYQQMLGAAPQSRSDSHVVSHVPGSNLVFSPTESSMTPTVGTVIDHIGLETDDIESFAERLRDAGIETESDPRYIERLDLWVLFFTDESGARVEITQGLDTW
jgi:catechol-2,3-dioxygenase